MPTEDDAVQELPQTTPDPKLYWAIHAHTLDWQILLHRLVSKVDPNRGLKALDPKIGVIGYNVKQQPMIPIWYLSREFFPVEKIAAFVGKRPEDLAGVETLHLREFKDAEGKPVTYADWEKPNVDYWGMA